MSKGNTPIKVLRTALKRVDKGWTKGEWVSKQEGVFVVCLEGAIYGFCDARKHQTTPAQHTAINVVQSVIRDRRGGNGVIPDFNDAIQTTKEDVMEVIKLAIIRLETGWDEDGVDDENFDQLLKDKENI